METKEKQVISIKTRVNAPVEFVWGCWTSPEDIVKWNNASDDWHTPWAKNDLQEGGRFISRMEAKDGSFGFDFGGTYHKIVNLEQISYSMDDDRKVDVLFSSAGGKTVVDESFEAESMNSAELQRNGWQSILDNFKKYTEEKYQSIKSGR